jgi:topoisomerase-4 subunit B
MAKNGDLFDRAGSRTGKANGYSAKDIEVLEGLEPVRKRPGMYIGGTDERAMHHLVAEVLDNAMDEAVSGHADTITVELMAGNKVLVRDNGRGIPVDPHPKSEQSALSDPTTHSGGKFSARSTRPPVAARRRRLGVNALSDELSSRSHATEAWQTLRGKPTSAQVGRPGADAAARRSLFIPIRRSSANMPSRPSGSTAWRDPSPTCSAASRSAGNAIRRCCPKAVRFRPRSRSTSPVA